MSLFSASNCVNKSTAGSDGRISADNSEENDVLCTTTHT